MSLWQELCGTERRGDKKRTLNGKKSKPERTMRGRGGFYMKDHILRLCSAQFITNPQLASDLLLKEFFSFFNFNLM